MFTSVSGFWLHASGSIFQRLRRTGPFPHLGGSPLCSLARLPGGSDQSHVALHCRQLRSGRGDGEPSIRDIEI